MARCHWRFVVRGANGAAIQNAAVYVYQPDTTTAFTGSAYDAYTGGSAAANPFITNAQGEVEGWFDTAQRVDVLVTDNSDTAYYSGTTSTISFTSFTERDNIRPAIADVPTSVGEAGDVVATLVNPFTAVTGAAGATGEWADAAHVHPYSALTPDVPVLGRTTASAGTGTDPAREDHIHPISGGTMPVSQLALSNSTTETAAAYLPIAANSVAVGSTFKFYVPFYTTNSTTSRVLTWRVRWGANGTPSGGVALGGSIAITGSTTAGTKDPGHIEGVVTIRTIGATGTAVADLRGFEALSVTTAVPVYVYSVDTSAATIDTTTQKDLIISAAWGVADATVTLYVTDAAIWQVS